MILRIFDAALPAGTPMVASSLAEDGMRVLCVAFRHGLDYRARVAAARFALDGQEAALVVDRLDAGAPPRPLPPAAAGPVLSGGGR